jgi:hypothetical protein
LTGASFVEQQGVHSSLRSGARTAERLLLLIFLFSLPLLNPWVRGDGVGYYANLTNPQTLNLYSMVADDPESFADLDGHRCQDNETNCVNTIQVNELSNIAAHTLTVTQTDTTTRTQDDGTKIETVTKTIVTFSTDKENPGEIVGAREFATATGIAKDGTRTLLGGSSNPILGDNISKGEAKNRLGSDAVKSYQEKAIVSRAEFFNRAVREDAANHPIRYAFRGAGLVTPFLELPEIAHGILAGIDALFSGAETVHDVKDIHEGKDQ